MTDLDRDGRPDVAAASTATNRVAVYLGTATGLAHAASLESGASPRGIVSVDLNQDGGIDIVSANYGGSNVSVLAGRPAQLGSFDAPIEFSAGGGARAVAAGDFNHDGRVDLATGNQAAASTTILWNDTEFVRAGFAFERIALPNSDPFSARAPKLADVNRNGIPDLILARQRKERQHHREAALVAVRAGFTSAGRSRSRLQRNPERDSGRTPIAWREQPQPRVGAARPPAEKGRKAR